MRTLVFKQRCSYMVRPRWAVTYLGRDIHVVVEMTVVVDKFGSGDEVPYCSYKQQGPPFQCVCPCPKASKAPILVYPHV